MGGESSTQWVIMCLYRILYSAWNHQRSSLLPCNINEVGAFKAHLGGRAGHKPGSALKGLFPLYGAEFGNLGGRVGGERKNHVPGPGHTVVLALP
jgi:hypothetical protein